MPNWQLLSQSSQQLTGTDIQTEDATCLLPHNQQGSKYTGKVMLKLYWPSYIRCLCKQGLICNGDIKNFKKQFKPGLKETVIQPNARTESAAIITSRLYIASYYHFHVIKIKKPN